MTIQTRKAKRKKRKHSQGYEIKTWRRLAKIEILGTFDGNFGVGDFDIAMPADAVFVVGDRWGPMTEIESEDSRAENCAE